jgi:hypothetical protein
VLDGLPGFNAVDIAVLLRDLPLPAAGDIVGFSTNDRQGGNTGTTCYTTYIACLITCYVAYYYVTYHIML